MKEIMFNDKYGLTEAVLNGRKTKIAKIENIIFTIIGRTLGFPFFIGFSLVGILILFIKWIVNYIIFGGEYIMYTNKINRKTISETYIELFGNEEDKSK